MPYNAFIFSCRNSRIVLPVELCVSSRIQAISSYVQASEASQERYVAYKNHEVANHRRS